MNKFKFKVKNILLFSRFLAVYRKNKIEYPDVLSHMNTVYGEPILVESFDNTDHWKIKKKEEWGSAVPDSICTFVEENVKVSKSSGANTLLIESTPVEATGRDWDGNEVTRPVSSGLITSEFLLKPGQVVSATVNTSHSYAGSWFSFWLLKKGEPGDEGYREIDIFEKFMDRDFERKYTMTIHGGTPDKRQMMNINYPLFMTDEGKLTFTCELGAHQAKIFINGLQVFLAEEPDFNGEYYVIFDDAPTTHGGKVDTNDIIKILPRFLEIIDFRIYENRGSD